MKNYQAVIFIGLILLSTLPTVAKCDDQDKDKQDKKGEDTLKSVGIGAAIGAAVGTGATAAVSLAGFTSAGVAAGSLAAATQASIGYVAAGSIFAGLQSVAATGAIVALGPVGLVVGAGAGLAYALS